MKSDAAKKRVQFDFTPKALDRLDLLGERINATTRAEVVRRALELLDVVSDGATKGHSIIVRTPDGREKELVLIGAGL